MITSLPDISEFPSYTLDAWQAWFGNAASLSLSRTPSDGVTIFYQSDIKLDGAWIDKGYLCQRAAESAGSRLLWHKIACRIPPGIEAAGRPGYTHILCFSRDVCISEQEPSIDVIPDLGIKTWERGMGLNACQMIGAFILQHTSTKTIVNPFCGHGSMLAVANALGLNAVGIERSQKRAETAKCLAVDLERRSWRPPLP